MKTLQFQNLNYSHMGQAPNLINYDENPNGESRLVFYSLFNSSMSVEVVAGIHFINS